MVYKMNTHDTNTITQSETNNQNVAYNALRVKSPSDNSRSKSRNRSVTPNSDLNVRPTFSDPGNFMVKQNAGSLDDAVYVEDNCENINPNLLRDPKLTALEDENRFLKEELKRQIAKTKFFQTKFKQLKQSIDKKQPVQNWASQHGPSNYPGVKSGRCNSVNGFGSVEKKKDVYISPMLQQDLSIKRKKSKSNRNSAMAINRKSTTNLPYVTPLDIASVGQLPLSTQGQFACASVKQEKSKAKEPVHNIELHRKIMNLERIILKKESTIRELKTKVVSASQGNTECCCDELRVIFEEKEEKLM